MTDVERHSEPDPVSTLGLLAHSPDCVKLLDLDGRLQFINEAGAGLLQLADRADIIGKSWSDGWPEAERHHIATAIATAGNGRIARFSAFCPTFKGAARWWDVVVSPVRDAGNRINSLLVISRDVTVHRQMEMRLQVSEQRFRALADNMSQLAWMGDSSGAIFWYNRRWFEFTGMTETEAAGWGWKKAHHPEHLDRVVLKITAHFASGEIWEDTFPLRGADGEYRWFLSRANPIRDGDGQVVLWCGTNTDITEQRRANARLHELARLIELSHEAILAWDLDHGIVLWNEGCEKLYGYSRTEALGARSHALLETRHGISVAEFQAILLERGEWKGELLHRAKDGSEVWVESRQELVRLADRTVVLETNRDITERRRADETRNILVAELDHRVKNTLAIVQSIAGQTARNARSIQDFNSNFNDRLQALSSAHNVLTDANWKGAELTELMTVLLAADRRIELIGPNVRLSAQSALQLSLIVHELISNAQRHGALTRSGGAISVSWTVQDGAPKRLQLTWRETGGPPVAAPGRAGFGLTLINRSSSPQSILAKLVFEPAGIVCHISADLPDAEDRSSMYFNPTRAHGSLHEQRAARQGGPATPPAHPRILIVEDEPLIAMQIEDILATANFVPVGPAGSVDAALKAAAEGGIDGAVLDRNLLGESVAPIIAAFVARGIPFAFVSGFNANDVPPDQAHIPFVSKPLMPDRLIDAVRTAMGAAAKS